MQKKELIMELSKRCNQPMVFTARIMPNKAFEEVVQYAKQTNQLRALDTALNSLKKANDGDILIIHGEGPSGVFSNFQMGKRSVGNQVCETPAESSFYGLQELSMLGRKFRSLVGGNVKSKITPQSIMKEYSA